MQEIVFPITKIDNDKFLVKADLSIYNKEAIVATCYKYSDRYFIHQVAENNCILVTFESKDSQKIADEVVKQFCTDLIDFQLRFDIDKKVGHIRDLIVEEAFKPVNKKS